MGIMSSRSGTKEWVFQRVANFSICLWGVIFLTLLVCLDTSSVDAVTFADWKNLFSPMWFKVYTSITLLLIGINSILAGWQIGTDYIKPVAVNKLYMLVVILGSLAYLVFGLYILWCGA